MAARRSQIYLTKEQWTRLVELRGRDGRPLATLIREAIDGYLEEASPSVDDTLRETAGALPGLEVPAREESDREGG